MEVEERGWEDPLAVVLQQQQQRRRQKDGEIFLSRSQAASHQSR